MKAAVLNQIKGRFDIEEIEIDAPMNREVLVEIKASSLCHSDLHLASDNYGVRLPAVLGHEFSGVVKQVGAAVREFSINDHVVSSCIESCGHCQRCLGGFTYRCERPGETVRSPEETPRLSRRATAVNPAFGCGGFAAFALVHENQLVSIPKEMPFPQAAILGCATLTGAGAVINEAKVRPGETVAILGVGGVGLNAISAARLCGAGRIIAVDTQPKKEALARKFGATDFINPADGDVVDAVRGLTGGKGVDHAFEMIGRKDTSESAIRMARLGGAIYLIGLHKPGSTIDVDVYRDCTLNQLRIVGVFLGASNVKHDIPMYADLYLRGQFNLDDLVSQEINLSQINDAFAELSSGALARSVITSF